jgi:hypothetical protein
MHRSPLSSVASDSQLKPDVGNASFEELKQASARFIDNLRANLTEKLFVGDKVLIQATELRTLSVQALRPKSKLDLKFEGPFTITKLVGDNAHEFDLPVRYGVLNV